MSDLKIGYQTFGYLPDYGKDFQVFYDQDFCDIGQHEDRQRVIYHRFIVYR